jgi:hypothetical protein
VTWVMWNLASLHLETVLGSAQDRCTVCARCMIGSQIILDAPDGSMRRQGSSESLVRLEIVLILKQDRCGVCVERTIDLEIVLDATDGTPR